MRVRLIGLVLLSAVAACGGGEADTTTPSQFPTGSVRSWFDALESGDTAAALELTFQRSMLVIVAAENDLDISTVGSLLRRGATAESAEEYLGDFGAALRERYGGSLAEVSVDGFSPIGESFAAVTVTGQSEATIIARRNESGLWQVDLVGTLGPALIAQLRGLLEAGLESDLSEDRDSISNAFEMDVIPSLEAASTHSPANLNLANELRIIKSDLGL